MGRRVLTRIPPAPIPATATPTRATLVAGADGANVRSGPGTNYLRLAHLDPGTEVPVVNRYGDWWQVLASLVVCFFARGIYSPDVMRRALAVTGCERSVDDLTRLAPSKKRGSFRDR
jgi:aldehyde:ferredoxin oxidoreductase